MADQVIMFGHGGLTMSGTFLRLESIVRALAVCHSSLVPIRKSVPNPPSVPPHGSCSPYVYRLLLALGLFVALPASHSLAASGTVQGQLVWVTDDVGNGCLPGRIYGGNFPSLEAAALWLASNKASAENCTTNQSWHYDYLG